MPTNNYKGIKRPIYRVAILIELTNTYSRGLLQGVVEYIRERRNWDYQLVEERWGENPLPWISHWDGDGIIARIESPEIAEAVELTGLPAVNVSPSNLLPSIDCLGTDNQEMAKLAFEHFLERGFKRFAFCCDPRFCWAVEREELFSKKVRESGYSCDVFRIPTETYDPDEQTNAIVEWIKSLPKATAIMACYDRLGREVLEACRKCGRSVPTEIAVIGVDNDEVFCNLSTPPLSSIIDNARTTGYEAAKLLELRMNGKAAAPKFHHTPPLGVVQRESSDALAVEDKDLALAAQFIHNHACEGIRVSDILEVVPLSRRVLEQKFKHHFGMTPREEIMRLRINRVKDLLARTEKSQSYIAEQTGFESAEYLSFVFKRETGITPSAYRKTASISHYPIF